MVDRANHRVLRVHPGKRFRGDRVRDRSELRSNAADEGFETRSVTDFIDVGELYEVRRRKEPCQLVEQCCRRRLAGSGASASAEDRSIPSYSG